MYCSGKNITGHSRTYYEHKVANISEYVKVGMWVDVNRVGKQVKGYVIVGLGMDVTRNQRASFKISFLPRILD